MHGSRQPAHRVGFPRFLGQVLLGLGGDPSVLMGAGRVTSLEGAFQRRAPEKEKPQGAGLLAAFEMVGRGGGIRTRDPLLPKQMRYQAALRPD